MTSVLFVFTSASETLAGHQTGWYLPEAAHPYYVIAPHFNIDFAAPQGPNPPVDQGSVEEFLNDEISVKFLKDEVVKAKLASAKKLSDVDVADYRAVFYIGGHGPVIDLPFDPVNIELASKFYQAGKVTSAVCHGTAGLVGAVDAAGKSIFAGKHYTGFSTFEEQLLDKVKEIPFLLENKITELGGIYEKAAQPWESKVVIDGHLITGQNPASAGAVGEAIIKALK